MEIQEDKERYLIMARPKKEKVIKEESLEKQLWKAADKLRKNIDAAEYKHVVLGLIFLKYISDSFEEMFDKLQKGEGEYAGADPEDKDEYKAENVFFVPTEARWSFLVGKAKQPDIGKIVDAAMDAIEKENASLKGVLPKVFARQNLDPSSLGSLIDLVGNIALGDAKARSADVLGHVFEYFLGEFALAEGKQGGQFYTPRCVVELLVAMLEPYEGRVFDPCCGSGGMFVQSERFVEEHQGRINDISIFGQESNQTTWRLAKMNLAIRGIDSSQVKWNNEGSFLNNAHKDLRADYVIANPPFNDSDWSGDQLRSDGRWQFGAPPTGNANFAWIQHFIFHLSPRGRAGFILANSALAGENTIENEIRREIVKSGLVECIVSIPDKLFHSTPIPVSIWFIDRNKSINTKNRNDEILFIDASKYGTSIDRTHSRITTDSIKEISEIFHNWRVNPEKYIDIPGLCKSVEKETVLNNNSILFPAAYIDIDHETEKNTEHSLKNIKSMWVTYQKYSECLNSRNEELNSNFKSVVELIESDFTLENFKLGDILDESNERLGDRTEPEVLTCTENAGIILQKDRFSKRVATENTSKYKFVRKTNIIYNPYLLWAGAIDQCWVVDEGITSPAYTVLTIKDGFDPTLVGRMLKSQLLLKMYDGISIGTIKRRRAPVDKFLGLEVMLPSIEYQKEYGIFSNSVQEYLGKLRDTETRLKNIMFKISDIWLL